MPDNKKLIFEREGGEENDYKFSSDPYAAHQKILKYALPGKKVLDVGCGAGYIGCEFKKKGCLAYGIEEDHLRAEKARGCLDMVIEADVEGEKLLPLQDNFFDLIIFADILEHLKRPDLLLSRFRRYLKEDGFIIVSVPNLARIDYRVKFLFGSFEYAEGGTMDKTHLRFFTKRTLLEMISSAGYSVQRVESSGKFSNSSVFNFLDTLLAFQFIVSAGKK